MEKRERNSKQLRSTRFTQFLDNLWQIRNLHGISNLLDDFYNNHFVYCNLYHSITNYVNRNEHEKRRESINFRQTCHEEKIKLYLTYLSRLSILLLTWIVSVIFVGNISNLSRKETTVNNVTDIVTVLECTNVMKNTIKSQIYLLHSGSDGKNFVQVTTWEMLNI